jgi:hypothetical protein
MSQSDRTESKNECILVNYTIIDYNLGIKGGWNTI